MQGCESELPGEKVATSLSAAAPQLDSTEDKRSTMLDRHSRLEAPGALLSKLSEKRKEMWDKSVFQHVNSNNSIQQA